MDLKCRLFFFSVLSLVLGGCMADADSPGLDIFTQSFDFSQDRYGWQHGFAEYPAGPNDSAFYELKFEYTADPTGSTKALMISGYNHSDDLFMYIKKKLDGLNPNTEYTITFNVNFLSDATVNSIGAGGSPGESVYFKVGATSSEPKTVIDNSMYVMNIDKGVQAESGNDMITVGDISTTSSSGFALVSRSNSAYVDSPLKVKSNYKGELWLIVGTDSGFEGVTTLYYTKVNVTLSASN